MQTGKLFVAEPRAHDQSQIGKPEEKHQPADVKQKGFHIEDRAAHPLHQPRQNKTTGEPHGAADNNAE